MMAQSILDFFWPGISPHGTHRAKPSLLEILMLLGKVANGVKRMEYVSAFFRKPLTLRLAKRGKGILGSWCRAVSADQRWQENKQKRLHNVLTKLQDAELGRSTVKPGLRLHAPSYFFSTVILRGSKSEILYRKRKCKKMPTTSIWIRDDTCCMKPNLARIDSVWLHNGQQGEALLKQLIWDSRRRLVQLSQWKHITRDKAPKVHSAIDGVVDLPGATPTCWNSRNR